MHLISVGFHHRRGVQIAARAVYRVQEMNRSMGRTGAYHRSGPHRSTKDHRQLIHWRKIECWEILDREHYSRGR